MLVVVVRAASDGDLKNGMDKVDIARHTDEEGVRSDSYYGLGCSPIGSLVTIDGDIVVSIKLTKEELKRFPEYFDPDRVVIDYDPVTMVPGDEEGEFVHLDWPRYTVVDSEGNEYEQAAGYVE